MRIANIKLNCRTNVLSNALILPLLQISELKFLKGALPVFWQSMFPEWAMNNSMLNHALQNRYLSSTSLKITVQQKIPLIFNIGKLPSRQRVSNTRLRNPCEKKLCGLLNFSTQVLMNTFLLQRHAKVRTAGSHMAVYGLVQSTSGNLT